MTFSTIPAFTYTGDYEIVDDNDNPITTSSGNWKIRFLTSGTLKITDLRGAENGIDVFLAGGGGGGGAAGAGGHCPCPRCVGKREDPTERLMAAADSIREELGPMVPSSVRRCQEHNDELSGSAKNSRHIMGKAMDFNCPKSTPAQIEACLARKKNAGEIRYWYRMSSGWYHFDID